LANANHFNLAQLRAGMRPFKLHWFPRLRSTNDHAAVMRARGDLFAPAIVLSGHQTAGRGRGGNSWWSAGGSITVTFVFPVEEHLAAHQVPLVAGLAVRDAAAELSGNDAIALKWPNDILYEGRKLAGLLCERIRKADLIGVGLNVNTPINKSPAGLRERITSLQSIARHPIDLTAALVCLSKHLHTALARRGERFFAQTLGRYDDHHALRGQHVTVVNHDQTITGTCQGLDSAGRLLLRDRKILHRVIAGEVRTLEKRS
jgi:BirA family biotin operon repressor/biotin-[acetyl-CoA-carboxylase] ligase